MFPVRRIRPSRLLSPYVKAFEERVQRLDATVVLRPLPARTEQFLEFYLADRYRVRDIASGAIETAPEAVLVGLQTYRRVDVLLGGALEAVHDPVHADRLFQPVWPLDRAADGHGFRGRRCAGAGDRPDRRAPGSRARAPPSSACVSEHRARLGQARDPYLRERAATTALHGGVRVADLARATDLGERQFERRFTRAVGVSPKRYARVLRFREALRLKAEGVETGWAAVAQAAGYVDQAHMIHEFQALAGDSPERLMAAMAPARETVVPVVGNLQSGQPAGS